MCRYVCRGWCRSTACAQRSSTAAACVLPEARRLGHRGAHPRLGPRRSAAAPPPPPPPPRAGGGPSGTRTALVIVASASLSVARFSHGVAQLRHREAQKRCCLSWCLLLKSCNFFRKWLTLSHKLSLIHATISHKVTGKNGEWNLTRENFAPCGALKFPKRKDGKLCPITD